MLRVLPPTFKPVLQQIRLLTGLNVGGKTRNNAIQLVLQQCCKKSCTFFVARFSVPLIKSEVFSVHTKKKKKLITNRHNKLQKVYSVLK